MGGWVVGGARVLSLDEIGVHIDNFWNTSALTISNVLIVQIRI